MNQKDNNYTTQLQAGLGLIEETKLLLSIYESNMTVLTLYNKALSSGMFPMITARRLRNIIAECFSPRYLKTDVALYLKKIAPILNSTILNQFLLILTAQANVILKDFIVEVYWQKYSSGRDFVSVDDARYFVSNAVQDGKTNKIWSETTIKRVSSYLLSCCADYGLLSSIRKSKREIQSIRIEDKTLLFFSYWLHFKGLGDNSIINHEIWKIFGLEPSDVRSELKNISKKGWLIVQSAVNITRISWTFDSIEEVVDVIIES